jgi:hypothetical protein
MNSSVKKFSTDEILNQPIFVGRLENADIWEEYCVHDPVPLLPKFFFLDDDNLDLFIIELPSEKHEFTARHILLQLGRQCEFIDSVGCGRRRRNHMEADDRVVPSYLTFNVHLAQGITTTLLSTVGISQKWSGKGGLDENAKMWFQNRNSFGLQYILCVKIDRDIIDVSYKLYDLQVMNSFYTFASTHSNALIQLKAFSNVKLSCYYTTEVNFLNQCKKLIFTHRIIYYILQIVRLKLHYITQVHKI